MKTSVFQVTRVLVRHATFALAISVPGSLNGSEAPSGSEKTNVDERIEKYNAHQFTKWFKEGRRAEQGRRQRPQPHRDR